MKNNANAIINAVKPAALDLEEDEIANNNQEIETQEWLQEQTKTRTTAVMPTKFEERRTVASSRPTRHRWSRRTGFQQGRTR